WKVTVTGLVCPASALSGPETGPMSWMSGLNHQTLFGLWFPPSPVAASMKKQLSFASPGSLGMRFTSRHSEFKNARRAEYARSRAKESRVFRMRRGHGAELSKG